MPHNDKEWRLHLFVAGSSLQSRQAVANLNDLVETRGHENVEVTIVDIFENPDIAIKRDILSIPTLIRDLPLPPMRIIGDLSNGERVWSLLTT